jgi:tRNA threonylcarbamoyladenosine biosynthesis protein TsaE
MRHFEFTADDEAGTEELGRALAACLPEQMTIALYGTLGSGKTRLVQALAAACGVPRETVVSPTFVLCHEYHGCRTLYHLDAYRLQTADEFWQIGAEEYFASPALTLIEWADRVQSCLPAERLEIRAEVVSETGRCFALTARGAPCESVLDALAARLERGGAEVRG